MIFKCNALPKNNTPTFDANLYSQQNGAGLGRSWLYIDRLTNKLGNFFNGAAHVTNFMVTQGQWYILHLGWDHLTTTLDFYVDGDAAAGGTFVTPVESADGQHVLGANKIFTGNRYVTITEYRLYNRKLTPTEIANYNQPYIMPSTGLDTEILFSEGSGVNVADTSGNGHNGIITTPEWTTDRPPYVQRTAIAGARTLIASPRSAV